MGIDIREETIELFDGEESITFLHISDIHLWFSTKVLKELREIILIQKPELIVLTGDYYDLPQGAESFRQFLIEISLTNRVLFIRGNHDGLFGKGVSNLLLNIPRVEYLESSVFHYITKKSNRLNITAWENREQLSSKSRAKNILLIHNPEDLVEKELEGIDVVFAGHLHGCQFIFFKFKNGTYFPGNLYYKHCADRKMIGETTLIVSRGLGDTLPLRWNCPKEVVFVKIV